MKQKKSIGVGIVGGMGYGARELLRLLTLHSEAEVVSVCSVSQVGEQVSVSHPGLSSFYDLSFSAELDHARLQQYEHRVVFLALQHGRSGKYVEEHFAEFKEYGYLVIDLSADFRLKDDAAHNACYPEFRADSRIRKQFVYGLPELNCEEISQSRYIANPGCLATAAILSVLPLAKLERVGAVAIDAKTGTSGAGRNPQDSMHHPERHGNAAAYKVLEHRHEPEIAQALTWAPWGEPMISFVPHLLPVSRGILLTSHVLLKDEHSKEEICALYREQYKGCPFVRIRAATPDLHSVVGSNFCDISLTVRGRQVVAIAVLDNLVKGMTGTAIQNMNLMCGLVETTGLWFPSVSPI